MCGGKKGIHDLLTKRSGHETTQPRAWGCTTAHMLQRNPGSQIPDEMHRSACKK